MKDLLQGLLSSAGLARVSAEIAHHALLSIRLRTHPREEAQLDPGATKFGDSPDLSAEFDWPAYHGEPLLFVAQIHLTDVAPYDWEHLLPERGWLYFFFDEDAFFETWPYDPTTWSVVWDDAGSPSVLQRTVRPQTGMKKRSYHPCALTWSSEWTLPHYDRYDASSLRRCGLPRPLTPEEEQAYFQVQASLAQTAGAQQHIPLHRLLGHADPVQWEMHQELAGDADDWQLLLQVDSDAAPETDWGDTGRIYYWIHKRDLLQRDFRRVQLILQCT